MDESSISDQSTISLGHPGDGQILCLDIMETAGEEKMEVASKNEAATSCMSGVETHQAKNYMEATCKLSMKATCEQAVEDNMEATCELPTKDNRKATKLEVEKAGPATR